MSEHITETRYKKYVVSVTQSFILEVPQHLGTGLYAKDWKEADDCSHFYIEEHRCASDFLDYLQEFREEAKRNCECWNCEIVAKEATDEDLKTYKNSTLAWKPK
jgi:hypothetical protein